MTDTTHLIKTWGGQVTTSRQFWETEPQIVLYGLKRHCEDGIKKHGGVPIEFKHKADDDVHVSEDGTPQQITRINAAYTFFMPNESAEQTLRKMAINEAQSEWYEDDE